MEWTPSSLTAIEPSAVDVSSIGEPIGARGVRFLDLADDRCAFIADDPEAIRIEDLRCCGLPVPADGSLLGRRYCEAHRKVVLVPRAPRLR
jgi:hypothetical protein